jgi:hypothetical protein
MSPAPSKPTDSISLAGVNMAANVGSKAEIENRIF